MQVKQGSEHEIENIPEQNSVCSVVLAQQSATQ